MNFKTQNLKLIIGIGNPSRKYKNTYHSVGLLFIDYLTKKITPSNFHILASEIFMNLSGDFVKSALKKYNARPDQLLIIHDDADIEIGKYKLSFGRGSAGHKGVNSIIEKLETKNFWRLRIGIRPTLENKTLNNKKREKAETFVLKKISKKDKKILVNLFKKITALLFNTDTLSTKTVKLFSKEKD